MAEKKGRIDTSLVGELARLLTETDLSEIEVEEGDLKIRVSRHSSVQHVAVAAPPPTSAYAPSAGSAHADSNVDEQNAGAESAAGAKTGGEVLSPMVGTAYYSPAPGADPFVKVGDHVAEGQTVMIVEAMKTMNQIPATRSGKVTAILVEDATPVEYGEPLLRIE